MPPSCLVRKTMFSRAVSVNAVIDWPSNLAASSARFLIGALIRQLRRELSTDFVKLI